MAALRVILGLVIFVLTFFISTPVFSASSTVGSRIPEGSCEGYLTVLAEAAREVGLEAALGAADAALGADAALAAALALALGWGISLA